MKRFERWRRIIPLLMVSAGSAGWLQMQERPTEAGVEPPPRAARAQAITPFEQVGLRPRPDVGKTSDVFAGRSWYVPPPPTPAAPAPAIMPAPAPSAPRLPFVYLGKIEEAGRAPVYFLQREEKMYAVGAGEVIDGTYRVEDETGGRLRLTYLPLDFAQVAELGGGP